MKKRNVFCGAMLLLAVLAGCSASERPMEQVALSGIVVDSEGHPMAGCSVSSPNRREENAIITDDAGKFETSVIPGRQKVSALCLEAGLEGELTLEVASAGKDDVEITVK